MTNSTRLAWKVPFEIGGRRRTRFKYMVCSGDQQELHTTCADKGHELHRQSYVLPLVVYVSCFSNDLSQGAAWKSENQPANFYLFTFTETCVSIGVVCSGGFQVYMYWGNEWLRDMMTQHEAKDKNRSGQPNGAREVALPPDCSMCAWLKHRTSKCCVISVLAL